MVHALLNCTPAPALHQGRAFLPPPTPGPSGRHRQCVRCQAAHRSVPSTYHTPVQPSTPLARTLIPFCLGIAAAGGVYFLKALRQPSRGEELPQHRSSLASYTAAEHGVYQYEPQQDYVAALAQTRQTAHIEKASAFQSDGEPARALAELRRALHENRCCRRPVSSPSCGAPELEALYRLHLLHTEDPSDYATLLQLRNMLGISTQIAARIEGEVAQLGAAYSI
ncbi:hypothetical protein ACKKBG_A07385 [Auxenochlorella protothecoides x Auxenochlorella symbiontica]